MVVDPRVVVTVASKSSPSVVVVSVAFDITAKARAAKNAINKSFLKRVNCILAMNWMGKLMGRKVQKPKNGGTLKH